MMVTYYLIARVWRDLGGRLVCLPRKQGSTRGFGANFGPFLVIQKPRDHPNFRKNALGVKMPF